VELEVRGWTGARSEVLTTLRMDDGRVVSRGAGVRRVQRGVSGGPGPCSRGQFPWERNVLVA